MGFSEEAVYNKAEKQKLIDVFHDYRCTRKISNQKLEEWVNEISRQINSNPEIRDDIYTSITKYIEEGKALGVKQFILTIYKRNGTVRQSFLTKEEFKLPYTFAVMSEFMPDEKRFYGTVSLTDELEGAMINIEYERDKDELHLCMYLKDRYHYCSHIEEQACMCSIL